MTRRRARRAGRRVVEAARESSWLVPAAFALLGAVLAVLMHKVGGEPAGDRPPITVDRERDSLMAGLALLFTGLSIVLSIASVSIQNVANRFSLRLLSVVSRGFASKITIGTFVLALTYFLVLQVQIRTQSGDDPARQGPLLVAVALILLSGVTIIVYIGRTLSWMRVDKTLQRISASTERAAKTFHREHRDDARLTAVSATPPPHAVPLRAVRSGYVVSVDTAALQEVAIGSQLTIGIDASTAAPLVRGQSIGWVASRAEVTAMASLPLAAVSDAVEMDDARDTEHDIAFGIDIVVDIALAALSPAVNDPRTAVECVDRLAVMLTNLADRHLGPHGRLGDDGTPSVVVAAATWADYVELATDQIIHYGSDDATVVAALSRLAAQLERVAVTRDDRSAAGALAERVQQAADRA